MKARTKGMLLFVGTLSMTLPMAGQAANWLMLQGTERPHSLPPVQIWGFLQPLYSTTDGTELPAGTPFAGQQAVFNTIAPNQESDSQFQVQRARVGARGQPFPLNPDINYFFLAEFGYNGITSGEGGSARVTDASVTLNQIPKARVRVGLFKYPGAEEALQAIHVFDYVNFSNVTDQLLLERFFDRDGGPACTTAAGGNAAACANEQTGPVGAFRDIGAQVFDAFRVGDWEHSYALMIGNGNGISGGDNDGAKDRYVYFSTEWILGEHEGPRRPGLKFFVWRQDGKRDLVTGGTGVQANGTEDTFDRERSGLGVTFRHGKYRAVAEYMKADGMIFEGTDGGAVAGTANAAGTAFASFNITPEGEADGYYLDFGYLVSPSIELDLRYDKLNRRTDSAAAEREFTTITLGVQHFFDPKNRLTLNYEFRDAQAPNLPGSNVANRILDSLDDRISLQFTTIF